VWYRTHAGQARRFKLGRYPGLTLSKARKAARAALTDRDRGKDPQADRRRERAELKARRAALRVSELCDLFVRDQKPRWRPATADSWVRYIERDIKPGLGRHLASEVGPDDILAFLEALTEKGRKPTSVSYAYEVTRRVWSWALAKRKVPSSPFLGLKVTDTLRRPQERSRIYNDQELRAILGAAPATELRVLVPLLFETAARQHEARSMRWEHVDLAGKVWSVPAESSKTRFAHRVPLTDRAVELLESIGPGAGYVFPAGNREGYVAPPARALTKLREACGVVDLRLHDIRRTVRQRLTDLGVDERTAESILGHRPPKLVRTYVPEEPIDRMRAALDRWSRHLAAIVAGEERRSADVLPFEGPR
jgi:integrase